MVETFSDPSELHLKKELKAIRKARFLRDPETCSSWRSPSSPKLFCGRIREDKKLLNNLDESSELPQVFQKRRKKVYLYNWGHHSHKSSDSGIRLDDLNILGSVRESPQDMQSRTSMKSGSTAIKLGQKRETFFDSPSAVYSARGTKSDSSGRRITMKPRRTALSRKQGLKNSVIQNMVDLPTNSLDVPNYLEQSDDTEPNPTQKIGYASHCASPVFSLSGCGSLSRSKFLKNARREGSSYAYTPASSNSRYRYGRRNPSAVESGDGTASSCDADEADRSKRMKDHGCGGCFSPSLSDTLRRNGCDILSGSRRLYSKRQSSGSFKKTYLPKFSQDFPLLANDCDTSASSVRTASDEISTNFTELDLEALSLLDGVRWPSCRSQQQSEALPGEPYDSVMSEHISLSRKYVPRSFDEIIGQNIVVQSLNNAVLKGRIAPAYIFQGPRGTGKTSSARIFTAALNCLSTEEYRPCRSCSACTDFNTGKGSSMREVDATNKKDISRLGFLIKRLLVSTTFSRYSVFLIDECHMLSSKSWSKFTKFLEDPLPHVVFIFITTDKDHLPLNIVSRCQKYIFHKIKDDDIVHRLRKLSAEENLDLELDALDLIALHSDGSLRNAETMLDQLTLPGKRITTSLVNDLVGVVSDEKLLDLLNVALSSNTTETVKMSREFMDFGADPASIVSQLAGLIMDIISGSYHLGSSESNRNFRGQIFTETELEKLQQALKILSDAENQLRLSSEWSTWFTAALLQLGATSNQEHMLSRSSSRQSNTEGNADASDIVKESLARKGLNPSLIHQESSSSSILETTSSHYSSHESQSDSMTKRDNLVSNFLPTNSISLDRDLLDAAQKDDATSKRIIRRVSPDKLAGIWRRSIQRCHSMTLRQLLSAHGKLVSITEIEGVLIVYIAFEDGSLKSRAERFLSIITNSIEFVLRHKVKVRIGLVPEVYLKAPRLMQDSSPSKHTDYVEYDVANGSDKDLNMAIPQLRRRSVDNGKVLLQHTPGKCDISPVSDKGFQGALSPVCSSNTRTIDEEKLENAWVQAEDYGATGWASHLENKDLLLQLNCVNGMTKNKSSMMLSISPKHANDDMNHEIEVSSIDNKKDPQKEQCGGRAEQYYAISPSLLHSNSFKSNIDKEKREFQDSCVLIVYIAFEDGSLKSRAERFLSIITNSIEFVLRHKVKVRIGLVPEVYLKAPRLMQDSSPSKHTDYVEYDVANGSDKDLNMAIPQLRRRSVDNGKVLLQHTPGKCDISPVSDKGFQGALSPVCSSNTRTIDEEKLENAWVQAEDYGATGWASHLENKDLLLQLNCVNGMTKNKSSMMLSISPKHANDDMNHEIEVSSIDNKKDPQKEQCGGRAEQYYAISPSLLHSNSFKSNIDKEKRSNEPGPGCGFCCWKISKHGSSKKQMK